MKSTMLSYLLILCPKKCMLCYLLMCGGHKCENLSREFVSSVGFVNMLKIAPKHPQVFWNLYTLVTGGLDLGLWILFLGYLFVPMVVMLFSPVSIV